jgi:type IV secretory pathway VirB2 component (pilin)
MWIKILYRKMETILAVILVVAVGITLLSGVMVYYYLNTFHSYRYS